jgi:hypothetical protein
MGPTSATWKPIDGKQASIFGVDDDMNGSTNSEVIFYVFLL